MLAFAGNSLLCRLALGEALIDPASFTAVRLLAGAAALALLRRRRNRRARGTWDAALALALYALLFSLAYVRLSAGIGALILFAAVQATMVGAGIAAGERPDRREWVGAAAAFAGMVVLVAPGLARPPLAAAAAMAIAGVAWGAYSLRGRGTPDPAATTAGNFARALPLAAAAVAGAAVVGELRLEPRGVLLAAVAGAITSGLGYAVWYAALSGLSATRAALVQLTVPVLAAGGGVLLLGERVTPRLAAAAALILGGVWLAGRMPATGPRADAP
jgi:drug/metabolite transporter (DMT)-like permease